MNNKSPKSRILLVNATTIFGGGEVYYKRLAKLLLEHYEIAALVFNPLLQDELEKLGIRVWRGETPSSCSILKRYRIVAKCLLKAIRHYEPHLVHLNGGPELFLTTIPAILGTPILVTYHNTFPNKTERFHKRLLLALSFRLAKKVICVTKVVQNELRDLFWANNTTVIPNWLDFVPARSTPTPLDGIRPLSLLFVSRVEAIKGIFDLLEAVKHLDNVHLDVVGDGSSLTSAMEQGINLPVTFHGFKKDVTSFYKNADLFILPTMWYEGQSIVLIEAMSCGVPCIISNIPAPVETAGNGQYALVFNSGDPVDLVNKIRSLQSDPARLIDLSENGRKYALATYSEEHVRPMYLDLLQSVLGHE